MLGTGKNDVEWVKAQELVPFMLLVSFAKNLKGGVSNLALINLKEGLRMVSRIEGCPSSGGRYRYERGS